MNRYKYGENYERKNGGPNEVAWCRGEASSPTPTTSFCLSGHLSFVHFLKKEY